MEICVSLQLHLSIKRQTVETYCLFATCSVIELHAFLVTLVRQFDFFLPENGQEVKMMRPMLITPLVVGEEHKGPQMPLKVTLLGN
jgi:hypothetical protein